MFGQGADHLKTEPEARFCIPIDFAAGDPAIHRTGILHSANVGGELAPDNLHQLLDDL